MSEALSLFTWEIFSLDIHSIRLLERIEKEIRHAWSENHRIARQMLHSHVSSDLVERYAVCGGFTSECGQPMLRYFDDLMSSSDDIKTAQNTQPNEFQHPVY